MTLFDQAVNHFVKCLGFKGSETPRQFDERDAVRLTHINRETHKDPFEWMNGDSTANCEEGKASDYIQITNLEDYAGPFSGRMTTRTPRLSTSASRKTFL